MTTNTQRKTAKPCEGLLLTAGIVLIILAFWTLLTATMGLLQWFSITEVGQILMATAVAAGQLAIFLYEGYHAPAVLSSMLGIWLGAAILEGITSSEKID